MQKNVENDKSNLRDHLANERTFLAWIRTSVGIIAFGFVIEKFALFMKQMSFIVGKETVVHLPASHGYSVVAGVFLIGFGTLLSLLSYLRFKKVEQQINQSNWRQASFLDLLLTLVVFIMGVLLMIYLIQNRF